MVKVSLMLPGMGTKSCVAGRLPSLGARRIVAPPTAETLKKRSFPRAWGQLRSAVPGVATVTGALPSTRVERTELVLRKPTRGGVLAAATKVLLSRLKLPFA